MPGTHIQRAGSRCKINGHSYPYQYKRTTHRKDGTRDACRPNIPRVPMGKPAPASACLPYARKASPRRYETTGDIKAIETNE